VRARGIEADEAFEVDTPTAAINILRDGEYLVRVDVDNHLTIVVVREGEAEVTDGSQAITVHAGALRSSRRDRLRGSGQQRELARRARWWWFGAARRWLACGPSIPRRWWPLWAAPTGAFRSRSAVGRR
jgi:hypothetical protein